MAGIAKFLFTVVFLLTASFVFAQKPKPKPATAAKPAGFQKFIPPKLTSMLGIRSDSVAVALEEAVQLVTLPLKITDDKKAIYTISSYQVRYTRRGVTEAEDMSGKTTPTTTTTIASFKTTPLPSNWTKALTGQLRIGEELYFFDIVAKDAQGRLMFAPDLKIRVK